MMRYQLRLWLVALLGYSVLTFSTAQAQPGALTALLNQVPDSADARTMMWYGAPNALADALGIRINSLADLNAMDARLRRLYLLETGTQLYFSNFSGLADATGWQQKYGINSFAISRELTVGAGAGRFGILLGSFEVDAIGSALAALGYQSSTEAGATVYRSADANAVLPAVAVTADSLIVAPTDQMAAVLSPAPGAASSAQVIGIDPAYAAIASVLENASGASGALISAVIFGGNYLNGIVFGQELSSQIASIRPQIGLNEFPLPAYNAAGIGYRFDGSQRYWVIALAYSDSGSAAQASTALQGRLDRYGSLQAPDSPLFASWRKSVSTAEVGGVPIVVAVMEAPSDIGWAEHMRGRDIAFLAN